MGQVQNYQDLCQRNRRVGSQGQEIRRHLAALVGAALSIGLACAQVPTATLKFDKDRAWASLVKQCGWGPRVPGTDAQIRCRDYMLAEAAKYCDNAHLEEFTHKWSQTGQTLHMWNVVGVQNWKNAKTRVLLIAHWDSRPTADEDPNPANRHKPILGADDGASGVAVLLELMRAMKGAKSDVGIMYALVDGEDLGPGIDEMLLGTRDFALKHLQVIDKTAIKPDYGILLDMIGNKDVRVPMEMQSYNYAKDVMNAFYDFAQTAGYGKTFPKEFGQAIDDDHIPLNQAGLPTIDLIDFVYTPWHTLGDTPDKCSAESLGKIGGMLQAWLTKRPVFVHASAPRGGGGSTQQKSQKNVSRKKRG